MNLFVHRCKGQTWQNTLIQMCHSESLLLSSRWYLKWNMAFAISPLLDSSITHISQWQHGLSLQACVLIKGWWHHNTVNVFVYIVIWMVYTCFQPDIFNLCNRKTDSVYLLYCTWWLWGRMIMFEAIIKMLKSTWKTNSVITQPWFTCSNKLQIASLIQWQHAPSHSCLSDTASAQAFSHRPWVICLYQRSKARLKQLPLFHLSRFRSGEAAQLQCDVTGCPGWRQLPPASWFHPWSLSVRQNLPEASVGSL